MVPYYFSQLRGNAGEGRDTRLHEVRISASAGAFSDPLQAVVGLLIL
jgi:hypothetical protein